MEKILVSACLLGVNCKYNGGNNYNEKVMEYLKDKEVIPICPEIMGGLPTPRLASEIKNEKVINIENMIYKIDGVEVMLDSDLAILYNVERLFSISS